jgi:predicted phage tail protein
VGQIRKVGSTPQGLEQMSTTTMKSVYFYGALRKKYGAKHSFAFANWFQLLGMLKSRFGPQIANEIEDGKWHLFDGAKKPGNDLEDKSVRTHKFEHNAVHLVPATEASSSVVRIILGIILIVIGYFFPVLAPYLYPLGMSLIIGGVVEMLTKQPIPNQDRLQDENASSIFNAARNVTTQGGPVPIVYGTVVRASSVVISSDFSADEPQ